MELKTGQIRQEGIEFMENNRSIDVLEKQLIAVGHNNALLESKPIETYIDLKVLKNRNEILEGMQETLKEKMGNL